MDFSHYTDEPVELAVALVNTLDDHSHDERLESPDDVKRFFGRHAKDWHGDQIEISESDLHEVRAIRARLRDAMTAGDPALSATALNSLLDLAAARPRVSVHDGTDPHLHFEPADASPVRWLAGVTAMGLSIVLVEEGLDRFGVCNARTCDDVFVDTSRNRSRRHCSDTCTTRENVAAYRRRQKSK